MRRRADGSSIGAVVVAFGSGLAAAAAFAAVPAPDVMTAGQRAIADHFAPLVARCERKDAAACGRLAERLHFATDDRETGRLETVLAGACTAGVAAGCAGQGTALVLGVDRKADAPRGTELLRQACRAKDAFACAELAEAYLNGQGGSHKGDEGLKIAREACEAHGGWPCMTMAGPLYQAGKEGEAAKLASRACDGGDAIACYQLGQQYAEGGRGVREDQARATALYQKACDRDFAQSCNNLAWQFLRGTGAPKDERRGRELLQQACELGDASACDELVRRGGDARAYCELWGAEACYQVASDLSKKKGETAAVADAIVTAGMRACARGHRGACRVLGHLADDHMKDCDAGQNVRDTCMFAGLIHARGLEMRGPGGRPVAPDSRRADREFARACDAGAEAACAALKARR